MSLVSCYHNLPFHCRYLNHSRNQKMLKDRSRYSVLHHQKSLPSCRQFQPVDHHCRSMSLPMSPIPVTKNDLAIAGHLHEKLRQASAIQSTNVWREGGGISLTCRGSSLISLAASSSFVLSNMYCYQCRRRIFLKGLFRETSNGCKIDVHSPGMTTVWTFWHLNSAATASVVWALKESKQRIDSLSVYFSSQIFFMCFAQISLIHLFIKSSSIHTFGWFAIMNPSGAFKLRMVRSVFAIKGHCSNYCRYFK